MMDGTNNLWPTFAAKLEALDLGELAEDEATLVYQELVDTGLIKSQSQHHQRRAQELLEAGKIREDPPK